MILGIGTDLIEIDRIQHIIQRFGQRFITRVFTGNEQTHAAQSHYPYASYAKRFAAKEACLKALGTGLSQGILWTDVEIYNQPQGQPHIRLLNKADILSRQQLLSHQHLQIHLTLTDTRLYAQAFVVISTIQENQVLNS